MREWTLDMERIQGVSTINEVYWTFTISPMGILEIQYSHLYENQPQADANA